MKLCTIRLPEELLEKANTQADFYKISFSQFVRYLLKTHEAREQIIISKKDILANTFDTFAVVYDLCTAYDISKHYPEDDFRFHIMQGEGERMFFVKNGRIK